MTQILALTAAALYGVADFAGGLASRSVSAWRVTIWSQVFGLPVLAIGVLLIGADGVTRSDLLLGALAGGFGLAGLVLLYTALAAGSMSIVAPIIGVLAAAIPVAWDIGAGASISSVHWLGIAIAVGSVILLAGHGSDASISLGTLARAIGAAIAFAAFIIAMSHTNESAGLWPFVSARLISIPVGFVVLAATSTTALPGRSMLRLIAFVGIVDIAAGMAIVLAVQRGPLGINAVLSSLYPAFTVLAAMLVLKERPRIVQIVGIVMAMIAAALLAL